MSTLLVKSNANGVVGLTVENHWTGAFIALDSDLIPFGADAKAKARGKWSEQKIAGLHHHRAALKIAAITEGPRHLRDEKLNAQGFSSFQLLKVTDNQPSKQGTNGMGASPGDLGRIQLATRGPYPYLGGVALNENFRVFPGAHRLLPQADQTVISGRKPITLNHQWLSIKRAITASDLDVIVKMRSGLFSSCKNATSVWIVQGENHMVRGCGECIRCEPGRQH